MNGDCEADQTGDSPEKVIYETLAGRCLAVIFKEKRSRKRTSKSKYRDQGTQHNEREGGKDIEEKLPKFSEKDMFDEFQKINGKCFWNPHLEESMRGVTYAGWIEPSTLLLTGRDIYLETLKSAWAKRILRPPVGYHLMSLGEVHGMDMQVVGQTQFTPLPDALCVIISELNTDNTPATLPSIEAKLKKLYHGIHPPAEEIVFEMLDTLIQQRKIFYTGNGYQIMTPALMSMPGIPAHLYDEKLLQQMKDSGFPAFYLPFVGSPVCSRKEMTSSYCQTSGSLENLDSSGACDSSFDQSGSLKSHPSPGDVISDDVKLERSMSMRSTKSPPQPFERSSSLRNSEKSPGGKSFYCSPEAGKSPKDINLKTSQAHQDKNKGEKSSLFSKLFGRNKKKSEEGQTEAVAYVTFSAQFPPPEWKWYESEYDSPNKKQNIKEKETDTPLFTDGHVAGDSVHSRHKLYEDRVRKSHHRRRSNDRKSNHRHSAHLRSISLDKSASPHRLSYHGNPPVDNEAIYERIEAHNGDLGASSRHVDIGYRLAHPAEESDRYFENDVATNGISSVNEFGRDIFCDRDITIKYEGMLPKRNTLYAMSCESGVNCIGTAHASPGNKHGALVKGKSSNNTKHKAESAGQLVTHVAEVHVSPSHSGSKDKETPKSAHCQPSKPKQRPNSAQNQNIPVLNPTKDQASTSCESIPVKDSDVPTSSCVTSRPTAESPSFAPSPECSSSINSSKSSTSKATVIESGIAVPKPSKTAKAAKTRKSETPASKASNHRRSKMPKPQNYVIENGMRMKQVYPHKSMLSSNVEVQNNCENHSDSKEARKIRSLSKQSQV